MPRFQQCKTSELSDDIVGVVLQRIRFHSYNGGINEATRPTEKQCGSAEPHEISLEGIQRERRRKNQERYRAKQKRYTVDLLNSCQQLRYQIQRLKFHQNEGPTIPLVKGNLWLIAAQYFHVVQHDLLVQPGNPSSALNFLRATMAAHIDIDMLASYWRVFGHLLPDSEIRLQRLDQISPNLLVANTTTKITLTKRVLYTVFPHLTSDTTKQENKRLHIAVTLMGRSLVLHGCVHFVWNSENSQLVSLQSQADMMSPLLHLLGNINDVSLVFSEALITPEGNLVTERISSDAVDVAWGVDRNQ